MGKIDEYASGRNDGLQLALKIVEEDGVDADVEAFKEEQKRELADYELKRVWESNGYSQALIDVRDVLKEEFIKNPEPHREE